MRRDLRAGADVSLWISIPCDPWCPWHRIFRRKTGKYAAWLRARRQRSVRALKGVTDIVRVLLRDFPRSNLKVAFEWPRMSEGWSAPGMGALRKILRHTCKFDGCAYGLPIKKQWQVITNHTPLVSILARRCPGVSDQHRHAPSSGKDLGASAFYPFALCADILRGLRSSGADSARAACRIHHVLAAAKRTREEKETQPEDEHAIKLAIAKLHTNLGHPSNQALARAVRLTGGSDLAIATALAHRCPTSESIKGPTNAAHIPGSLRQSKDFGEKIAIDLFELADCFGKSCTFLNTLDTATGFQICTPVESKFPAVVWSKLLDSWISWAGPPHKLLADNGGEFNRELAQELESMGVTIEHTAALAPTQKCCV